MDGLSPKTSFESGEIITRFIVLGKLSCSDVVAWLGVSKAANRVVRTIVDRDLKAIDPMNVTAKDSWKELKPLKGQGYHAAYKLIESFRYNKQIISKKIERGDFDEFMGDVPESVRPIFFVSPLEWAASHGQAEFVRVLFLIKGKMNPSSRDIENALGKLVNQDSVDTDIVMLLLKHKSACEADIAFSLQMLAAKGCIEPVKAILKLENEHINTKIVDRAVWYAITHNHTEVVKICLDDSRADPNNKGNVQLAMRSDEIGMLIVGHLRFDPQANDHQAMRLAAGKGYNGVLKKILSNPCSDPTAQNYAAVLECSSRHHEYVDILTTLLNDSRVDPLMAQNHLSFNPSDKILKAFINHPRVNAADALTMALERGHSHAFTIFLNQVHNKLSTGNKVTFLLRAIVSGNRESSRVLFNDLYRLAKSSKQTHYLLYAVFLFCIAYGCLKLLKRNLRVSSLT